ncbi:MAG: M1 family metallopeptidase [Flavobacteriales bacterium]|nr:M1 family metallopeptidase [Flavobacteriales bacterium]
MAIHNFQNKLLLLSIFLITKTIAFGQDHESTNKNKFRQLKQEFATPNAYHNAAGAPGHAYYQNKANYDIKITLDDDKSRISGEETVTYFNNSPDKLTYLWVQLDQNVRDKNSETVKVRTMKMDENLDFDQIRRLHNVFDGGFELSYVQDSKGKDLPYTINKTMMRIDLPTALNPKESFSFKVKWAYNIQDRMQFGGRSGYEYFEEDDNKLYTIAQFYPRMAVYNAVEGWQNKQFLGSGEFALPFGDFKVSITVPGDHIVGATGVLQNSTDVLNAKQQARMKKARTATTQPVLIVTQEEAEEAEKSKVKSTKTWTYKAKNVRDFAFATSRKFIWDAMAVKMGERTVMAMSLYPKEGNPLWGQYSTKVVAHTVKTYSKFTFDYPYPVAYSVNGKRIGMEYPMICFNFGRPEEDGTYAERTKNGMIGVIIHEVGHNFFPMIVNSDERQWTWMDEGLNTFLQYLTEKEWDRNFPSRRGPSYQIVDYMKGDKKFISPIMTNSESIMQFGNNAYGKPATALNILRETIMGRELFDFAFKEYSQRWMFKHPTPEDFFRTMEDASAVDLDWFWRGWFYGTDHVDLSVDGVELFKINTRDPEVEKPLAQAAEDIKSSYIATDRDAKSIPQTYVESDPALQDFYHKYDPYSISILDKEEYQDYLAKLSDEDIDIMNQDLNYYEIKFSNVGGLVMPIILEFEFADGSTQKEYIPAEIWRFGSSTVHKVFPFAKELVSVELDPNLETADVNRNNNYWPAKQEPTRFQLYKKKKIMRWEEAGENPMQRAKRAQQREEELKDTGDSK